jgi:drug/metabolite transporter (DMT)-like permease
MIIFSSSFILVKIILFNIGPFTIAGLRYFLAFVFLLPFLYRKDKKPASIKPEVWIQLVIIGISGYAFGNGAMFWGLRYLDATSVSFMMGALPVLIMLAGILFLGEHPSSWQIFGVILCLAGGYIFFSPGLDSIEPLGFGLVILALFGFTIYGIKSRLVAKSGRVNSLELTAFPLGIGGGLILVIGLLFEGLPALPITGWLMVSLLVVVHTAFGNFLYNQALRTISALEMNIILNASPFMTALMAWIVLGEDLILIQLVGVLIAILGVTIVQIAGNWKAETFQTGLGQR